MAGPWEDYAKPAQTSAAPWEEYSAKTDAPKNGATGSWALKEPTRLEKFGKGLRDPIDGGAQLLTNMLPDGIVKAGNSVNNWLADKTGIVSRLPEGGLNQQIKRQDTDYEAARGPNAGFDGYRVLGNVLNPANVAISARAPLLASLAGRVGVGAASGAVSAALNPISNDDYWGEKGKQVAIGSAFGGVVPAVVGGVGRVISPNASTNPALQTLRNEGINPTVGQSLGGWANKVEERLTSLPIMGDAISYARNSAVTDLNRAAFNRALAPLEKTLPKDVSVGHDAVQFTKQALSESYDRVLPKLATKADDQFLAPIESLRSMVREGALDPKYINAFEKTLDTRVLGKFQGQNSISGQTLKDTQSLLSQEIQRYGASQDPDARLVANAYKEIGAELNDLVIRSNPKYATELKAIDTGYANFKRAQKAAASLGSDEGIFTAAQLNNAVKAADRSKDKARFAEGNAYMQDLSGAGKSLLSNKVSDSGTAGRAALGLGALGAGAFNPAIPLGLLGGAALYAPSVQGLLRGAVASRPQSAQAIRNSLLKASPGLLPGSAQVGLGLLN